MENNADEFIPFLNGWINDPSEVRRIAAMQPQRWFAETPAGQNTEALPDHIYLWEGARKVLGPKGLPVRNQGQVGSCVSFGTARAAEYTYLWDIAFNGLIANFIDFCQEAIYGGSRHEIGKDRCGRSDGSVGAWAAQWLNQYGVVTREVLNDGKYDLRTYSEARCLQWGTTGVPDDLEPFAKQYPFKGIAQIRNWDEAKKALAQGHAIAVSSNQGFRMTRDKDGFADPHGVWGHCTCLCGFKTKNREGGRIDNSWGPNAHTGPVGDGDPDTGGFWADANVLDEMLKEGDSWVISSFAGFPAKKIRWVF